MFGPESFRKIIFSNLTTCPIQKKVEHTCDATTACIYLYHHQLNCIVFEERLLSISTLEYNNCNVNA